MDIAEENKFRLNKASLRELAIVFFISLILFSLLYRVYPLYGDEGQITVGAMRALHGQVIYRDFFKFLPPGSIYLMALFYKIFGLSVNVNITTTVITFAIIAVLTYWLTKKLAGGIFFPLVSLFFFVTVCAPTWYEISQHWFSTCTAMLALVCLIKFLESSKGYLIFICGFLIGATVLFLHHKGGLLFFAFAILLGFNSLLENKPDKLKRLTWSISLVSGGLLLAVFPFVAYLIIEGALKESVYDLFYWVRESYYNFNRYPFYYYDGIVITKGAIKSYLFPRAVFQCRTYIIVGITHLLGVISGFVLGVREIQNRNRKHGLIILSVSLTGACLIASIVYRADFVHILFTLPVAFPLFLRLLERLRKSHASLIPLLIIPFILDWGAGYFMNIIRIYSSKAAPIHTKSGTLWTIQGPGLAAQWQAFYDFFQEKDPKDGDVFIYSRAHSIYFNLRLLPPTPYDDILPGHNTPEQLSEAISSLQKRRPEFVVEDFLVDAIIKNKMAVRYPMADIDAFLGDPVKAYIRGNYERLSLNAAMPVLKRREE